MSEKLTGADHTKLDDQFTQMEKITDVFLEVEVEIVLNRGKKYFLVSYHIVIFQTEMYEKTRDILYPNPAIKVKQVSDKGIASIGVSFFL